MSVRVEQVEAWTHAVAALTFLLLVIGVVLSLL